MAGARQETRPFGCLLRVFMSGGGYVGLFYCLVHIVLKNPGWKFYSADAVYAGFVAALLAARFAYSAMYEDAAGADGPPDEESARKTGFQGYAVALVAFSAAAWLVARGIGHLIG